MSQWLRFLTTTATLCFLGGALLIAFSPNGIATVSIDRWQAKAQIARTIDRNWEVLIADSPTLGAQDGTDIILEFVDYRCTFCRAFHPILQSVLDRHSSVKAVIRHAPHPHLAGSRAAAIAAICAAEQGVFAEMHTFLLTDSLWVREDNWERPARRAHVPLVDMFLQCMESNAAADRLATDLAWADSLGIRGTPAFVSQSAGLHIGLLREPDLSAWLDLPRPSEARRSSAFDRQELSGTSYSGRVNPGLLVPSSPIGKLR